MTLLKQSRRFATIGVAQWLIDWGVMVGLSRLGVPVALANIAGRISGAALGFWLNGRITFPRDGRGPGWRQFGRYAALWIVSTVISTGAVSAIDRAFGLGWAWLAKPLIDGVLSIGSFVLSRQWIYR